MPDICLISGGDFDRQSSRSPLNHKIFATEAGLDYRFEVGPYRGLLSPYYFKLEALRQTLPRYDWVVWMDDDAFVTDFDGRFQSFIDDAERGGKCLVVGDSPINARGEQTKLNSGVLLVKNCAQSFELLEVSLATKVADMQATWDVSKFGRFSFGDQDALIRAMDSLGAEDAVDIVDHLRLNARPHEYRSKSKDHFICHFAGVAHKRAAISDFADLIGTDETLVPGSLLQSFGVKPQPTMPVASRRLADARARVGQSDTANNVLGALSKRSKRT